MKDLTSLLQVASTVVHTCLDVKEDDRTLIITDLNTLEVSNAIKVAAEKVAPCRVFILEEIGRRPLKHLPNALLKQIKWATVTIFAATIEPSELSMRLKLLETVTKYARHAHMPGITPEIMRNSMAGDYNKISEMTRKVYEKANVAKRCRVTCPRGSDVTVEFDPNHRWVPCDGMYHIKGIWGNLPEGEVFTAPRIVEGRIVTPLLGDWFAKKFGVIERTPISMLLEHSRVKIESIQCVNSELLVELRKYLLTDENSSRVGEFAIGTNIFLTKLVGNMLQDEKFPGVHVAFGNPYPEETLAKWHSSTHIDVLIPDCTVELDGTVIMRNGQYTF